MILKIWGRSYPHTSFFLGNFSIGFLWGNWNLTFPSLQSMIAPEVLKKGLPKIIGLGVSIGTLVNDHMDISVDTVVNDHSTCSAHDLACQNGLIFPDASSSGIDMPSCVHENDPDDVANDWTVETKTCYGDLSDFKGMR